MRRGLTPAVAAVAIITILAGGAADGRTLAHTHQPSRRAVLSSEFHGARVDFQSQPGAVRMLGGSPIRPVARRSELGNPQTSTAAARAFLGRNARLFGVSAGSDLALARAETAMDGRTILRYQQRYHAVPVLAGDLVVDVSRGNDVISVNGEASRDLSLDVDPAVTASQARTTALARIAQDRHVDAGSLSATDPRLWVYDARLFGTEGGYGTTLTWRVDVSAGTPVTMNELVLVDAHKGVVMLHFDQVESASPNRIVCDRHNVVRALRTCGSSGDPPVIQANGAGYAMATPDAQRAFDYAGHTWTFYFERFGRNSLDGRGLALKSTVRYCEPGFGCPYKNAFWNGSQMAYGAGFASGDDVDGHELTHGLTQFTSNLFYYYESGAINEAMSDIMGEFIDQDFDDSHDNDKPSKKWLIGEDVPGYPNGLRNMRDPLESADIAQPDRMTSSKWYSAPNSYADQGGVHVNSGVANKAAYLLGEDRSHPAIAFNGRSIKPLGRDKAAALFFEVDAHILTSGSRYADLASAMTQACQNLLGTTPKTIGGAPSPTGAFTAKNCTQVKKTIVATEMRHRARNGPRPSIPACPAATPHRTSLFNDPVEYTGAEAHAPNFRWSLGFGWSVDGSNATSVDRTIGFHDFHGVDYGTGTASNANVKNEYLTLKAARHIPAHSYLRFKQWYVFDNGSEYGNDHSRYDGGRVEYSTNNGATWNDLGPLFDSNGYDGTIATRRGNPLAGRRAFSGQSDGYFASRANLSSLANKSARFRWHIGTDRQWGDPGWYLDDISIYTCS